MSDWRAYPIVGKCDATIDGAACFMVRWLDPINGRVLSGDIYRISRRQVRRARREMTHFRIRRFETFKFPWARILHGSGQWPEMAATGQKSRRRRPVSI